MPGEAEASAQGEFVRTIEETGPVIDSLKIYDISDTSNKYPLVADLLDKNSSQPELKLGKSYGLELKVKNLQPGDNYIYINLKNGLYFIGFPPVNLKNVEEVIKPDSNPKVYGQYNDKKLEKMNQIGDYVVKINNDKNGSSKEFAFEINEQRSNIIPFSVDASYVDSDKNQTVPIKVDITDKGPEERNGKYIEHDYGANSYSVKLTDVIRYNFQGLDENKNVITTKDYSFTKEPDTASIEIVYSKEVILKKVTENNIYKREGIVEESPGNSNTTASIKWEKSPGYYFPDEGFLSFTPEFDVSGINYNKEDTSKEYQFTVVIKNLNKSILNSEIGRNSDNSVILTYHYNKDNPNGSLTVEKTKIGDNNAKPSPPSPSSGGESGEIDPSKPGTTEIKNLFFVPFIDTMPNWAINKYNTYNVRLGGAEITNKKEGVKDNSVPVCLKIEADINNQAIIRGITIPWYKNIQYDSISWEGEKNQSTLDQEKINSIIKKEKLINDNGNSTSNALLIKNTDLGLDIDDSIKKITVNYKTIPYGYVGVLGPTSDNYWNGEFEKNYHHQEYHGWDKIGCAVYGSWKKEQTGDIITKISLTNSNSEEISKNSEVKSGRPVILAGWGTLNKEYINVTDKPNEDENMFKISGFIDATQGHDWIQLQDPVLYTFMPEGFTCKDLKISINDGIEKKLDGNVSESSIIVNGRNFTICKYPIDIGNGTFGNYQPDFTEGLSSCKDIKVDMDIKIDTNVSSGYYYISDFVGFSTNLKEGEINPNIDLVHYKNLHYNNWFISDYTKLDNKNIFSDNNGDFENIFGKEVNNGKTMASFNDAIPNKGNHYKREGVLIQNNFNLGSKSNISLIDNKDKETEITGQIIKLTPTDKIKQHIKINSSLSKSLAGKQKVKIFIPLMKQNANLGTVFMPNGNIQFPVKVTDIDIEGFDLFYLKLKDKYKDKKYNKFNAINMEIENDGSENDFDILNGSNKEQKEQADLLMFFSNTDNITEPKATIYYKLDADSIKEEINNQNEKFPKSLLEYTLEYNNRFNMVSPVLSYQKKNSNYIEAQTPLELKPVLPIEFINVSVKKSLGTWG